MRIIISPAKQMKVDTDTFENTDTSVFVAKAEVLKNWIAGLSYDEQKKLWNCNDKIAVLNSRRFETMELRKELTPAILAFDGIQYTYMGSTVFETAQYEYIQQHLRILSGFYGALKPMDGVVPYRLEMQSKINMNGYHDLYSFWGDSIYSEIVDDSHIIISATDNLSFHNHTLSYMRMIGSKCSFTIDAAISDISLIPLSSSLKSSTKSISYTSVNCVDNTPCKSRGTGSGSL